MSETQTPSDHTAQMLASVEAGIRALQDRLAVGGGTSAEAVETGLKAVQSKLAEVETNLVRRITRLESQLNQLRNAHTIYLGDHEALTRLHTGHRVYVDTRDVGICSHLMLEGRWEPWIEKIIAEAVKPGMTFLDVGANFGYYTLLGAAWVGAAGKVYSFEANPQIYRHLRKSVSINGFDGHVTLHNLAVHSEEATLRFSYTDEYSGGGSTMGGPQGSHQVEVKAAPLDTLLANVPLVNVMKVDVEGSEPYVFQGARALIGRSPDLTLIVEFHEGSTRPILPPLQYLQSFIDQGFTLALIEPKGLSETMTAEQCLQTLRGQLGYLYLKRGY
ncbi:FkbM family methyltransferase [Roseomonas sp. E05]|uniref:FkbM family methyltransferase n=1 Tax=Roseomonas sp. E05 TaxID=3046310 RepID=UPI0024B90105|nr:FkbM family methyltransferase [Roseomonas sp. E05]MDJ0388946.1 FkbM family methyltransferase [Roseomonas sp. E05]